MKQLSWLLPVVFLLGCRSTEKTSTPNSDSTATGSDVAAAVPADVPSTTTQPATTAPPPDSGAANRDFGDPASTGSLSEVEFKALHELRSDEPPPRHGITVKIADSQAYLSLPKNAKTPMPAVIIIHEWWGLNEHIKHWADRIAAEGYAAIAVDLYGGRIATNPDDAMAYMKSVNAKNAQRVLDAAVTFAKTDKRVNASKIASIGWCFGGGWSLQVAIAHADLDAAVMYYGRPVTDTKVLSGIHAPVLGIFGNLDKGISPEAVDEFEKALKTAGVQHKILRYDANHAFANPSSAKYDQPSAASAWAEVQTFLKTHLATAR